MLLFSSSYVQTLYRLDSYESKRSDKEILKCSWKNTVHENNNFVSVSRRNIGMAQLRLEHVISVALFSLSIKAAENSAKDESVGENMSTSLPKSAES